jgi:uncharacterized protein YdhG (YjbR/CyaY superfamily)
MQDVENLITELPPDERVITKRLRSIILDSDPRIQEKLSYGVPYFFHNRRICFVWPASCQPYPTGKASPAEKVTLGFCYGNLLSNDQGVLIKENRKQVYLIKYKSPAEIDEQIVREILQEAIMVDESFRK